MVDCSAVLPDTLGNALHLFRPPGHSRLRSNPRQRKLCSGERDYKFALQLTQVFAPTHAAYFDAKVHNSGSFAGIAGNE